MIHWPKKEDGMPRFKQYADKMPGVPLQTVWTDIRPLHNLSWNEQFQPYDPDYLETFFEQ